MSWKRRYLIWKGDEGFSVRPERIDDHGLGCSSMLRYFRFLRPAPLTSTGKFYTILLNNTRASNYSRPQSYLQKKKYIYFDSEL